MPRLRQELRRLTDLAVPVVVAQLATMFLSVVDTLMVGNVGVNVLAAASLGHVWTFGTIIFGMGVIYGIDPLISQGHGARDARRQGLALQRGLVVAAGVSVPIGILWALTGRALVALGQDPELAALSQSYVAVQIPSLPFFMGYVALRQYLQGRGIMRPAMIVAIAANVFNALANWVLIYGVGSFEGLGIVGAGIATAATRTIMMLALGAFILRARLHVEAWIPWSRDAFAWRGLREILNLGWPIGLQMSFEVWAFHAATLIAGRLGEAELAAHTIVLNVASVSFMVPLGVGMAAATRVGNFLGAGRPRAAQRAAWVALATGASVMAVSAVLFVICRHLIPIPYTSDPVVRALAASVFPIAAAFQLFDGTQVVGSGILRGMGSTRPAALFNLIGYYVLALPLAAWMTFRLDLGLLGIWWGLAIGLASVALMLVAWVHWRGPRHATALVTPAA